MTISEMHTAVKLGLDKTSSLELPAFEPEEIDFWLNKAILQFIKTRYSGTNVKGESFEQTQKRTNDLRTLVTEAAISALSAGSSSDKPYSYIVDLSVSVPTYMFKVGEEVTIRYLNTSGTYTTKRQGVTECTADSYRQMIDNPYSEHRLHLEEAKPLRLYKGNSIELITDGNYTITSYFLRYIKNPATVSLTIPTNCDLPPYTHHEIVDMTVSMLLENIESNRGQSFDAQKMSNE